MSFSVTCAENATVVASGSLKAPNAPKLAAAGSKSKKVKLNPETVQVQANVPTTISLAVSKKGRKLLKQALAAGKKPKGTVDVSVTDDLAQSAQDAFKVKIKGEEEVGRGRPRRSVRSVGWPLTAKRLAKML